LLYSVVVEAALQMMAVQVFIHLVVVAVGLPLGLLM
jgi:hypothetical protein